MKEATIITQFQQLWRAVHSVAQGFKVSVVSQGVRDQAIENLLVKKGVFTKQELDTEVQSEAQKLVKGQQAPAEDTTSEGSVPETTSPTPTETTEETPKQSSDQ